MLLCFTADPYQPAEMEHGITREAIEILHSHGFPMTVLTKGGRRSLRDLDLYRPGDEYAASLTLCDPGDSAEWEPGAAPPGERIEALREAHEAGIRTWASMEPVIDPRQTLYLIRRTSPWVDLYKVGTLNHHPLAQQTDWARFASDAVALLDSLGKTYYLKEDLRRWLPCPDLVPLLDEGSPETLSLFA